MALCCGACRREANELAHDHSHHSQSEHHDEEGEDHDHEGHEHENEHGKGDADIITLSSEAAERLGVGCDTATVSNFGGAVKVAGTIAASAEGSGVATAPTSGIITLARGIELGAEISRGAQVATVKADGMSGGDPNRAAKADLDAATEEFKRVEILYKDRLVTLAEYNAAKAALERSRASYSAPASTGRVSSPVSGVITSIDVASGSYVSAGQPIITVSSSDALTLRADVPARLYPSVADAADARIVSPATGSSVTVSSLGGRRAARAASAAGAAGGFVPVTFTMRNDGSLIPGTTVEVYLLTPGSHSAIAVPSAAIVEQQGAYFVFVRLDDDCYRKTPVERGVSDGDMVEITRGLQGGEAVVTRGVTAVKLAQNAGAVPAGHSHSH